MTAFGDSKYADKLSDNIQDKIYSYKTYEVYQNNTQRILKQIQKKHPEINTLEQARPYVKSYLQGLEAEGKSPWTINTYLASFNKLYQCKTKDWEMEAPTRKSENIKNNRNDGTKRVRFSEEKNKDLVDFCRASGLRRREVLAMKGNSMQKIDDKYYIDVLNGKGGRERRVLMIGDPTTLERLYNRFKASDGFVFARISSHAPIHKYRAEYARNIYEQNARNLEEISSKEKYYARGARKGSHYDRLALKIATENLGHTRIGVVVTNYLN